MKHTARCADCGHAQPVVGHCACGAAVCEQCRREYHNPPGAGSGCASFAGNEFMRGLTAATTRRVL